MSFMKRDPEYDAKRHDANVRIMALLVTYLDKHPEIRLGQALVNLGIVQIMREKGSDFHWVEDPYNEEPWVTLERASATYLSMGI